MKNMYNNKLQYKNGKFTILQFADIQEISAFSPDTLRLMNRAIETAKPDLIIFSGDQLYGIAPCYHTGKIEEKVRRVIKIICGVCEELNTPFAVTFGNHDNQCGVTNNAQAEIYLESPMCVAGEYFNEDDKGSMFIPLYDGKNKHILDIILIDSGGQCPTGEYMAVTEKQISDYRRLRKKYSENGITTPAVVFQHIPVPEYYNVLECAPFYEKGSVEAFRTHKNEWYRLPAKIKADGGFMGESPATPDKNSGEFEALHEGGNVMALIVGHDHNNSFVAPYEGIDLVYTQGAGFNVYGPGKNRGARVVTLYENNPKEYKTFTLTYSELCSEPLSKPLQEFVFTHIPTSMEQVKRLAVVASAAFSLASIGIYGFYKKSKGK